MQYGLLVMAAVQIGTGVAMLFSVKRKTVWGIATLPVELSVYRYMLTGLWLSVGLVYLVGSFQTLITPGAALLAVINSLFEIVGYLKSNIPLWYKLSATIFMLVVGVWCMMILFASV